MSSRIDPTASPSPDPSLDHPLDTALDPSLVIPARVAHWASVEPDRAFLVEVGGRSLTFGQAFDEVRRWATYLRALGVQPGDRVASFLPASVDAQLVWLACGCIGAWEVPVNPELRGEMLRHVLTDSAPVVCLARDDNAHVPQESGVDVRVVAVPRDGSLVRDVTPAVFERLPQPDDVSCVIYTSGTTGPSKGAVIRWAQFGGILGRVPRHWYGSNDGVYAPLPMFHVTGRTPTLSMADAGGRVVLRERFSVTDFWDDVRNFNCTSTTVSSAALLMAQPPRHDDADNPMRFAMFGVTGRLALAFGERFDVQVVSNYGSTEIGFPITNRNCNADNAHLAGWLRPGYEARVVDTEGSLVPFGQVGELHIKPPDRLMMTAGYLNRPDATASAIVDGWYRTGDAVMMFADGSVQFVDRIKDTIRRFGENISSAQLETVINTDPEVVECAVLGIASDVAGHEVLLVVRPVSVEGFSAQTLYERLRETLPRHCLPAFISTRTDEFPKTPNGKIRKVALDGERDRVAAGHTWVSPSAVASRSR
ncbi:MAG: class I adenylate-forming enzyme family protein [Acidimicrobiia bacterium]